jgi:type II secretory pathway pseudopilin PulG
MEPKSIAFYTAVAVSILAVLSATTFPTLAQAQQADDTEESQQAAAETESAESTTEDPQEEMNDEAEPEEEPKEEPKEENSNSAKSAASQSLGLLPSSGVASCGEIVNEDVTLTSDLECGPGDGLIVGANDITINLNGYSITSSDEAGSEDPSMNYDGSSGILVPNAQNVAISGLGEVSGFDRGITFMGSSGGQVADIQLANNDIGVLILSPITGLH